MSRDRLPVRDPEAHRGPCGIECGRSGQARAKPLGNLVSVPFQENAYFNVGPEERTQNVLNIQPVIPTSINDDWNIITRTILPIISQPHLPRTGAGRTASET